MDTKLGWGISSAVRARTSRVSANLIEDVTRYGSDLLVSRGVCMTMDTVAQEKPARKRLDEFLTLIRECSPECIAAFLQSSFTSENLKRESLDQRIGSFMEWKARGGFDVFNVVRSDAEYIEVLARQPKTDERWRLAMQVETDAPFLIEQLLLGRATLPIISPTLADEDAANELIRYVWNLSSQGLFSGAVLIARHGSVLAQEAFGFANRDFEIPNSLSTRFNVACLCKSWTAIAICQLIEEGLLTLETPVSTFLDYPDANSARKILIAHLLTHTSGLDSYFTDEFGRGASQSMRSVDEFLQLTKDQLPLFEPGSAWKYSSTGMVLLGKVIEILTGRSYFDHIQHSVLDRAGMTGSGFPELDQVNLDLAVGYSKRWSVEGCVEFNNRFESPVKGDPACHSYSTVSDIFRFAEAFKAGKLVSPDMADLMTRSKPGYNSADYGFGFFIHPERALYGHSGRVPGASANLDITVEPEGWVVVVAANELSMRAPVLKARQLIGVTVPESE